MRYFDLFTDELGNANLFDNNSEVYILCGCAVNTDYRKKLKILADQVKFKYWGHTEIVFHSRDIGRREKDFAIFKKNKQNYLCFINDLLTFLKRANFTVFVIVCDKKVAKNKGWNQIKIIRDTIRILYYHFISWLMGLSSSKGRITIESATAEKDRYYLNDFSYFLSPGCKELSIGYKKIRSILTSLSFVTKENSDIEEQLADLLAYAAKCKFMRSAKRSTFKVGSYEDRLIKVLEKKLFIFPDGVKDKKMKFYNIIKPFCVVPEQ